MGGYQTLITLIVIGFFVLAALLLGPIYRFLQREERAAEQWTAEDLRKRRRDHLEESAGEVSPEDAESASAGETGEDPISTNR